MVTIGSTTAELMPGRKPARYALPGGAGVPGGGGRGGGPGAQQPQVVGDGGVGARRSSRSGGRSGVVPHIAWRGWRWVTVHSAQGEAWRWLSTCPWDGWPVQEIGYCDLACYLAMLVRFDRGVVPIVRHLIVTGRLWPKAE